MKKQHSKHRTWAMVVFCLATILLSQDMMPTIETPNHLLWHVIFYVSSVMFGAMLHEAIWDRS